MQFEVAVLLLFVRVQQTPPKNPKPVIVSCPLEQAASQSRIKATSSAVLP
jgi:hypothetical protein